MSDFDFDLIVIGAGSGGVRLARMAASLGAKVAIAEDRYLGGTCVNVGCVPKKLFVYASHIEEDLNDAKGYGWNIPEAPEFDWSTLVENKNNEISRLNGIYKSILENAGVQIIDGRARFKDKHSVEINDVVYTAERTAITTGSWPFVPSFPGSEHAKTSNDFFYLDKLPDRAVVLGGGYIAIELAGILAGLGTKTKLIYRGELFLRGFDQEVREFVKEEVQKKGIELIFNDNITSIESKTDSYFVACDSGNIIETDLVIAATGRVPHTQDLGLENVSIDTQPNGTIIVDDQFRTSTSNIFALGDITGGMQLTPVALAEGMFLANHLFGKKEPPAIDYKNIATAVFCQPNIGTVGLTEENAIKEHKDIDVYVSKFRPMKHTMSGNDEKCLMKLIVDAKTDRILGAHMVGAEAGEIIQGISIAINSGATKQTFDSTIGIHPTAAEEFVTMRDVTRQHRSE